MPSDDSPTPKREANRTARTRWVLYGQLIWNGFLFHTGLFIVGALAFAPMSGWLDYLGLTALFWPSSVGKAIFVGLSLGALLVHFGITSFLLASRKPDLAKVVGHRASTEEGANLGEYLFATVPVFGLIGFATAFVSLWLFVEHSPLTIVSVVTILLSTPVGVAGWMLVLTGVAHSERWGEIGRKGAANKGFQLVEKYAPAGPASEQRLIDDQFRQFHTIAAASVALLGFFWVAFGFAVWGGLPIPTAVSWFLICGLVVSIYGASRFHLGSRRVVPMVVLTAGVALVASLIGPTCQVMESGCDALRDPELAFECEGNLWWEDPPALGGPSGRDSGLLDDQAVRSAWANRATSAMPQGCNTQKPPIIVIATTGGGIRAAGWTTAVLHALEVEAHARGIPNLHDYVRLISGASGGMVGAAHYVSALPEVQTCWAPTDPKWTWPAADAVDFPEHDPGRAAFCAATSPSLDPAAAHLVLPTFDSRGQALQDQWVADSQGRLGVPLNYLRACEGSATIPSLVFTPFVVEDGSQLVMSNLDLPFLADQPQGRHPVVHQFFADFEAPMVTLATAARLNASFPYVTNGVPLPYAGSPRAVDAGYYDNYGVRTAALWLRHAQQDLEKQTSGVLLIQIRDHDIYAPPSYPWWRWGVHEITTPAEAFLGAATSRDGHRADTAADAVRMLYSPNHLETTVIEFPDTASLSWVLTEGERESLWSTAHDHDQVRESVSWLLDRLGCPRPEGQIRVEAAEYGCD